jgi:hypothetical protein
MTIIELRKKAISLGIKPGKMKKLELVHAIQKAQGNFACYGSTNGNCDQVKCCFRKDCLKINNS